ncbi:MAG: CxxC-x17-CxxC domain-containing protein [Patescibacteria group bacterium]
MKNFNGGGNRGGGYKGGDRGDKQLFKVTCSECKKGCEVPFRPSGGRPVFCSECFSTKKDSGDSRGSNRNFDSRPLRRDFNDRQSPRAEYSRPADSRYSFNKPNLSPANDDTKKQLSDISFKLDKLINAIEKMSAPIKSVPEKVEIKEIKKDTQIPVVKKVVLKKTETPIAKKKVVKIKV